MSENAKQTVVDGPNTSPDEAMATGSTVVLHDSRFELYGDEQARYEDLQTWDYASLKSRLIALNNEACAGQSEPITDFHENYSMMGGGWMGMAGVDIHFPIPEDREDLFRYALKKAQAAQNIQDAALLLGTAVVAIHPFGDGNGRTSRALYAQLSRGWDDTNEEYRRLTAPHGVDEQGSEARETIDLGSILIGSSVGNYADWYTYTKSDLDLKLAPLASYDRYEDGRIKFPSQEEMPHVANEDYQVILQSVGLDEKGFLRTTDVKGLRFALGKVLQKRSLGEKYITPASEPHSFPKANLGQVLTQEDPAVAHELAQAIGEYAKLRALAAIDFLTDDFGGQLQVRRPDGEVGFIKDLVIEETDNYMSI